MPKFYFTFGQAHAHAYGGVTFNKDCVVEIEAADDNQARDRMFDAFGSRWSMQYDHLPDMSFFPRGVMKI